MNQYSLLHPKYLQENYVPMLCEYYDRSDMVSTTFHFDHAHSLAEIMYVRRGMISLKIDGEVIMLGRKQFIWIDSGVPHRNVYFETDQVSMMNVEYNYAKDTSLPGLQALYAQYEPLRYLFSNPKPYRIFTDSDNSMYLLLKQLTQIGALSEEARRLSSVLCTQLLLLLSNFWKKSGSKADSNHYIQYTNSYLREHYRENVQIKEIASQLKIHPNYLQKIYKLHNQLTIMEQLNEIRLSHARELLAQEALPLCSLAERTGFHSPQYLQKLFLKKYGVRVQEYGAL